MADSVFVVASFPLDRPAARWENQGLTLFERNYMPAALRSWALFYEKRLTAGVIRSSSAQSE
ncbi:Uncharacterised protein [Mycobacteroides abscessus subsp. abscessus]|nr:Uncharacterised protein [Mycobacteroides abscessus subsp. abscessus]